MAVKLDLRKIFRRQGREAQSENLQRFLSGQSVRGLQFEPLDEDTERIKAPITRTKRGREKRFRFRVLGVRVSGTKGAIGRSSGKMQRQITRASNLKVRRTGYRINLPKGETRSRYFLFNIGTKDQPARAFSGLSDRTLRRHTDELAKEVRDQIVKQAQGDIDKATIKLGGRQIVGRDNAIRAIQNKLEDLKIQRLLRTF